jgi:pyruvate kinase
VSSQVGPRSRKVRVLATLGPASGSPEMIRKLALAGADAFRINMSHGAHADKIPIVQAIRALEKELGRATTILFDLQGPKLRVGRFMEGKVMLETGQHFTLDRSKDLGDATRVELPHKEIFAALEVGARLLLDDGKLVLRVKSVAPGQDRDSWSRSGGKLSDRKGRQRPRRRRAAGRADRKGPRRPVVRARAGMSTGSRCRSSSGPKTSPKRVV